MIETLEQYEEYGDNDVRLTWPPHSWAVLWDADIRPTIESLRVVARAAQALSNDEESQEGGWGPDVTMLIPLRAALDALPEWILEENDE